jgi:aryl-alcohol dehydrogenase-like predicted oxidoreductase
MAAPARVLDPASIQQECEASLRRLGTEQIDLLQFHWPDESGAAVEDSWAALVKLAEQGKIRAAGVCNFGVDLLRRCETVAHVTSLQPPFSLIRRGIAASALPWCAENGTGVIVYSPMQAGLLTERFSSERMASLPEDDWRRKAPFFESPALEANLALRDALVPIARRRGVTTGAVAIAWTLAWTGVSGAIVGARTAEQVEGWIAAAELVLEAGELDEIAGAIERSGAGSGPTRP